MQPIEMLGDAFEKQLFGYCSNTDDTERLDIKEIFYFYFKNIKIR